MIKGYIKIARIDHWFKNIFMIPGLVLAWIFRPVLFSDLLVPVALGIFSTCLVASANYVINEWLDREFDKFHPMKKQRPSVSTNLNPVFVYAEYIVLIILGLSIAANISMQFLGFSIILLLMGVLYNVKPFRTKDKPYLDVLSESVNNPLRLLLGWSIMIPDVLPPSSILLSYWMGGAFLMAVKRYAEFRFIDNPSQAGMYRKSFQTYTEQSLLLSSFFYANLSSFFLAIFLIKYRIEFILSFPFFALMFVWYLSIGMQPESAAKDPEKIFRDPKFLSLCIFISVLIGVLFFVDIPVLHWLENRIEF